MDVGVVAIFDDGWHRRHRRAVSETRTYVCFRSAFRGDACPCISHETGDGVRTYCGRLVADAATVEPDSNNLDPDCRTCYRAAQKRKTSTK